MPSFFDTLTHEVDQYSQQPQQTKSTLQALQEQLQKFETTRLEINKQLEDIKEIVNDIKKDLSQLNFVPNNLWDIDYEQKLFNDKQTNLQKQPVPYVMYKSDRKRFLKKMHPGMSDQERMRQIQLPVINQALSPLSDEYYKTKCKIIETQHALYVKIKDKIKKCFYLIGNYMGDLDLYEQDKKVFDTQIDKELSASRDEVSRMSR